MSRGLEHVNLPFISFVSSAQLISFLRVAIGYVLLLAFVHAPSNAQTVVNGQVFTNALAILDAPAPNTVLHAGSDINLAIDVSRDGVISQAASIPNSTLPTRFDFLNIYLVSSQTALNLTVSSGPALLTQESGSTVKHYNWPIPTCVSPGEYNLTIYEGSHVNGTGFYSITPVPVEVQNNAVNGSCSVGTNDIFDQPQASNPPPPGAILALSKPSPTVTLPSLTSSRMMTVPSSPTPSIPGIITVTIGPSGPTWPLTVTTGGDATIVIGLPAPSVITITDDSTIEATVTASGRTVTVTATPTSTPQPVTVVLVSVETLTTTATVSGQDIVKTVTQTATETTIMPGIQDPGDGLLSVNAATCFPKLSYSTFWTLGTLAFVFVYAV